LNYNPSEGSGCDENYDEVGDLEIDLDYNNYVNMSIVEEEEPLDLSINKTNKENINELNKPNLPTLEIKPIFNFAKLDKRTEQAVVSNDNKDSVATEQQIAKLLDPYVKKVNKKFSCTVCDIKFACKVKALTHVENRHVDCLLYKCPLCRASKGTRLAYESHLRRGHGAKVKDYCPSIRIKKSFYVKSEFREIQTETQAGQPYDLEFVTFLRHTLSMGKEMDMSGNTLDKCISCAEWIDQDQGVFRINNREQFARGWYRFKGLNCESWAYLYASVITEFINKNIFKQLFSDDFVFQVFCIKQLLK